MRPLALCLPALFVAAAIAQEPSSAPQAHCWYKVAPPLEGRRWDVPLGATDGGELFILGGRTDFGSYKKPRPYDVLKWNGAAWENQFPAGKEWGPLVGNANAPGWKGESWGFLDAEGNARPNWCVYGTFSLGQKYGWDPDTKKFYFYAKEKTFAYDPAAREWMDLKPPTNPEGELGGILLWSSMCYDAHHKRFILFGGGNITSDRGDPGTWAYSPAKNEWTQLKVAEQPPRRANSRLSYDPLAKKILLFGGDSLNVLYMDTWSFDVTTDRWAQEKTFGDPSNRAGHALLWLPNAKQTLLLGGYEYTSSVGYVADQYRPLPFEAWLYKAETRSWTMVQRWAKNQAPQTPSNFFVSAAVQSRDGKDIVTVLGTDGLWQCTFTGDPEPEVKQPRNGWEFKRRTDSYDPVWYTTDVPPADAAKSEQELRDLPTNRWVKRATPKLPGMNMDWGSAVFDTANDKILRFSGGHSAYSGTAPFVYDVKTDRYSLPFAPELPIEYVYSNDQVHGEWSFGGNPWMSGHTYKSTGYDPRLRQMVFAPHDYTYFFDVTSSPPRHWTRNQVTNPYRRDFYNVTLCATPDGCVAWGDPRTGKDRLWKLDAESRTWKPLTVNGALPDKSPDQHGMAFDSKRRRLLLFSNVGKHRGDVTAVDLVTGEATLLNAAGADLARVPSRETAYLPEADVVLLGARATIDGEPRWLFYDCAANAWKTIALAGDDPIGKGTEGKAFHNSVGLMVDPARKLVFAVGQYSHVHVLRPDFAAAR